MPPLDEQAQALSALAGTPESALPVVDLPIELDIPCLNCGYNLRGLRTIGNCPECGTPNAQSIRGDHLRFSNPDWLSRLILGSRLMLWSVILLIPFIIMAMLLRSASRAAHSPPTYAPTQDQMILMVFGLGISALWFTGLWLVTTPEPRDRAAESALSLRSVLRGLVVICALSRLGEVACQFLVTSPAAARTLGFIFLPFALLNLVVFFSLFVYYRRLALRVPDSFLALQTRWVMWGFAGILTLFVLNALIMLASIYWSPTTSFSLDSLSLCACGLFLFLLIISIWALIVLCSYIQSLKTARQAALAAKPK